tara:strand:- start:262 stop:522 length:261 start_codon:yes stop_codon:yes gene_type:complete
LHEFFSTKFRKGWGAAKDKHKGNHQVAGLTHFRGSKPIFGKFLSAGLYTDFGTIDKHLTASLGLLLNDKYLDEFITFGHNIRLIVF